MGKGFETSMIDEDRKAYKLLASSYWKNALNAPAPHMPPEFYFVVAVLTWGVPKPESPEDICRRLESLESLYEPAECPTKEDVVRIQDWLVTDEVKEHVDLEQWAKDELAKDEVLKEEDAKLQLAIEELIKERRAKEQRRPRRPNEDSADNWLQWVLKPLGWLFGRMEQDLDSS